MVASDISAPSVSPGQSPTLRARQSVVVVAYLGDDASGWLPTVVDLRRAASVADCEVVVAASVACANLDGVEIDVVAGSLSELLTEVLRSRDVGWVLIAGEPCLVPEALIEGLARFQDGRFASVSFLCNAAGTLSFPFPGTPVPWALQGSTPSAITGRLRNISPVPIPTPVPVADGPLIAFAASTARMMPSGWDQGGRTWDESVAVYSLAMQQRGLLNVLDSMTYVHRAADLRPLAGPDPAKDARIARLAPWLQTAVESAVAEPDSPLHLEHRVARAKIAGLDLLLDGSCLGPLEMGTQVGLVSICRALVLRDDVASVSVTLSGALPGYARLLATEPKIGLVRSKGDGELDTERMFDVAFRPFQPDVGYRPDVFRRYARRVVVSILDLIAYQNGSYHSNGAVWSNYRRAITDSLRRVDGVTTISHDVVTMMEFERLPVGTERVFPVPYGTEHVGVDVPKRMPEELGRIPDARFLVCLGTNYGHKNRDLAIRTIQLLRDRGHDLRLILAGPTVPMGSSRLLEARAAADLTGEPVIALADVTAEERNWLLAHAEVVLYPTAAEGFGLVPYEAAWLGTPTVFVPFGPLLEIAGTDLPVASLDWSPASFADAVEAQLADPAVGSAQVASLREASALHSWAHTAEALCTVFREIMSMAPVA